MLPLLTSKIAKARRSVNTFEGLNLQPDAKYSNLCDDYNTQSGLYPYLKSRSPRYELKDVSGTVCDLNADTRLYYVYTDKTQKMLSYNDKSYVIGQTEDEVKDVHTSKIGGDIFILPDKKVFHAQDESVETLNNSLSFDGQYSYLKCQDEFPSYATGFDKNVIAAVTSTGIYARVQGSSSAFYYINFTNTFKAGDVVNIKATVYPEPATYDENYYALVNKFKDGINVKLTGVKKTTHKLNKKQYIEYTALLYDTDAVSLGGFETVDIADITVSRPVPDLVDVCALNNRLWGVSKNAIHTSKLGDASEWNDFSTDSYGTLPSSCFTAEVDTGGDFTAVCVYNGNVLAFKENCIHKIYGDRPDEYTIVTQDCPGVQKGAEKTLAVLDGVLYYKGTNGVYAYSGSSPVLISSPLGDSSFTAQYAATDGICYYIAASYNQNNVIYSYNPRRNIWHIHSGYADLTAMAQYNNSLCMAVENKIITSGIGSKASEIQTEWHFAMKFNEKSYNRKSYTKLKIKYSLKDGAYFYMSVYYDDNPIKKYAHSEFNTDENGYAFIPLPQYGCREIKVVFEGKGDFTLKNLTREYITQNEGGK